MLGRRIDAHTHRFAVRRQGTPSREGPFRLRQRHGPATQLLLHLRVCKQAAPTRHQGNTSLHDASHRRAPTQGLPNTADKLRSGARVRPGRRGHEPAPPSAERCRRKLRQLHPLVRRRLARLQLHQQLVRCATAIALARCRAGRHVQSQRALRPRAQLLVDLDACARAQTLPLAPSIRELRLPDLARVRLRASTRECCRTQAPHRLPHGHAGRPGASTHQAASARSAAALDVARSSSTRACERARQQDCESSSRTQRARLGSSTPAEPALIRSPRAARPWVRRTPRISCEAVPASVPAGAGMRRHLHSGNRCRRKLRQLHALVRRRPRSSRPSPFAVSAHSPRSIAAFATTRAAAACGSQSRASRARTSRRYALRLVAERRRSLRAMSAARRAATTACRDSPRHIGSHRRRATLPATASAMDCAACTRSDPRQVPTIACKSDAIMPSIDASASCHP